MFKGNLVKLISILGFLIGLGVVFSACTSNSDPSSEGHVVKDHSKKELTKDEFCVEETVNNYVKKQITFAKIDDTKLIEIAPKGVAQCMARFDSCTKEEFGFLDQWYKAPQSYPLGNNSECLRDAEEWEEAIRDLLPLKAQEFCTKDVVKKYLQLNRNDITKVDSIKDEAIKECLTLAKDCREAFLMQLANSLHKDRSYHYQPEDDQCKHNITQQWREKLRELSKK